MEKITKIIIINFLFNLVVLFLFLYSFFLFCESFFLFRHLYYKFSLFLYQDLPILFCSPDKNKNLFIYYFTFSNSSSVLCCLVIPYSDLKKWYASNFFIGVLICSLENKISDELNVFCSSWSLSLRFDKFNFRDS